MQSTIVMINLAGAVALLLFGLAQVKQGVSRAFGAQLRTGLAAGTNGASRAFLSGLTATIALQSSTATALMVSSFVERGLVRPRMAQIVLLGANVGTAVTAWIVAAGIVWLSPLLILSGVVLQRGRGTARQGAGVALTGIGLMLLSLHLMSAATDPLRSSPALAAFIGLLDDAWPVALIIAAALAFIASSSLAIVVLVLSIAGTGVLSPGLVVALVLGANLGGAIPPVVASLGAGAAARRVVLGNLVVRAAGCLLALPLADQAGALLALLPLPQDKLPVDAHLAFNLALAALAWPFAGLVCEAMRRLVPDGPKAATAPRFLDPTELSIPLVALTSATREVLGVGDLIERMLVQVLDAFRRRDLSPLQDIPALERGVDILQQEVKLYLSKLGQEGASEEDRAKSLVIVDYAINLEHIGDIIEKGLLEQVGKIVSNGLRFSDAGYRELDKLFELTIENLRIAQTIFVTRDMTLARRLMSIKVEVRVLERQSAERHLQRLREGHAASLQTSSLHLDILRDLKRINAHIVSVAHPIMDEKGLLAESRVLDPAAR